MTQREFVQVASLSKPNLHKMLLGLNFKTALRFRREIQEALTSYSKGTGGRDDSIKAGAVSACQQIERWCREAYFKHRLGEVLVQTPGLIYKGKAAAKGIIRKEWEELILRASY